MKIPFSMIFMLIVMVMTGCAGPEGSELIPSNTNNESEIDERINALVGRVSFDDDAPLR